MPLKIGTYNCQSFTANFSFITSLLSELDVLFLQETFLHEYNNDILANLGPEYDFAYVSSTRKTDAFVGRSKGGLVIVWRKICNICCVPRYFNDRIMGVRLRYGCQTLLLLNVYLPCDYGDNNSLIDYKFQISELYNIAITESYDEILIIGDFNCDPVKSRFFKELSKLVRELSLCVRDLENLPADSYSYVSRNNVCGTSWLDHVVSSSTCNPHSFELMYGITFEDHIPLTFSLEFDQGLNAKIPENGLNRERYLVDWNKVNNHSISEYRTYLDSFFCSYSNIAFSCSNEFCSDANHLKAINDAYCYLTNSIIMASKHCLPSFPHSGRKYKPIAGWNDKCKEAHAAARSAFLLWHHNGRIRNGTAFNEMKVSRARFRRILRDCKSNELKIKRHKFAEAFGESNKSKFWKEVGRLNPRHRPVGIDGICSESGIVEIFEQKFKKILFNEFNGRSAISSNFANSSFISRLLFEGRVIDDSIDRLGVDTGFDFIHSSHLKFSGNIFRSFLRRVFSTMINHSYLPDEMLRGHIKPVIKDKKICQSLSSNYRPVMNSSMLMKVFEYSLQPVLVRKLNINPLQFGFTPGSDCHSAILFAKETILSYTGANSNVHGAAVDLSKAFDRVNFDILFDKLCKTGLPCSIVRIIDYMLRNTYVNVCYGDAIGEEWKVRSGVRQGGILSPLLFNFYINECIAEVSLQKVGCRLCFQPANIICYADDVLLLAPSNSGLQKLLDVFSRAVEGLNLVINEDKTNYIVFGRKCPSDTICLSGTNLNRVVSIRYLGVTLSEDLSIKNDVERVLDSFLKQFNGMYSKFGFVDFDCLCYLFKTYSTTFYGMGLWIEQKVFKRQIQKLSVAYHKAVKRIASLNVWDSNHLACERVGVDTMPHLIAKRLLAFYSSLRFSSCVTISVLRYYFLYLSNLKSCIQTMFRDSYGVINASCNDFDALNARIDFVQKNEPRSCYVPSN